MGNALPLIPLPSIKISNDFQNCYGLQKVNAKFQRKGKVLLKKLKNHLLEYY